MTVEIRINVAKQLRLIGQYLLPIFVLLVGWEMFSRFGPVSKQFMPPPSEVVVTFFSLLSSERNFVLWSHVQASLGRAALAFLLALSCGTALGLLMGVSRLLNYLINPIIEVLMPIPAIATVPILLIGIGRGERTLVIVLTLAAIFPILYNTMSGVKGITRHQVWAVQSMGASRFQLARTVLFPGAMPGILAGMRLGMAFNWRALVAVEMIAASTGVGFMIFAARATMSTDVMYAGIVVLALMGLLFEQGFAQLERRTLKRWGHGTR